MRLWVWLGLSACGFHPGVASDGAAPSEGVVFADAADALSDAAPVQSCLAKWEAGAVHFSPRQRLANLFTSSTERDPGLSHDLEQIWFSSDRGGTGTLGGADIWTATRTSTTSDFGSPMPFNEASSNQDDGRYYRSDDDLTYVVSSSRTNTKGGYDVWISHRAHVADAFPAPSNTLMSPVVDDALDQYDPWISDDGTRLYYAPTDPLGQEIYLATRADFTASFAVSILQSPLTVGQPTADPFVFDHELVIAFSSHSTSNVDGGTHSDLWYSMRTSISNPWSAPINMLDLNTQDSEGDPWVSSDGCHIYFAAANAGDYDLYEADVL
jgi:hypothetical protein